MFSTVQSSEFFATCASPLLLPFFEGFLIDYYPTPFALLIPALQKKVVRLNAFGVQWFNVFLIGKEGAAERRNGGWKM